LDKPFKRKEVTKSEQIPLKATPDERKLIDQRAEDCGLSRSEFLLRCALGRPVRSKIAATIINELRDLAQQQKELYQASGGHAFEAEYRAIMNALVEAISRVAASGAKGLEDDS
jgi:uncharacterized protein (DUF1778 family)